MNEGNVLARFEGFVECPCFSGRAQISVTSEGFAASTPVDDLVVPFELIKGVSFVDYAISLDTSLGIVRLSRLGREAEWLYDKLLGAFNDAVAKAFMVEGLCAFEAKGRYAASEGGNSFGGPCVARVYDDCALLLAPDANARRIPFCFVSDLSKGDWSLTFSLSTGESYAVSHMGRDLDNFERVAVGKLQALRERTTQWHAQLASLQAVEAVAARRLMLIGAAAFASDLAQMAPGLLKGIEDKLAASRIAAYYPWLKRIAGGLEYAVGANPPELAEKGGSKAAVTPAGDVVPGAAAALVGDNVLPADPAMESVEGEEEPSPIVWVVAPVGGGRLAAVELALADGEAAATYLYRVEGAWRSFVLQVSRALEAAKFERGPVFLPDEDLARHDHAAEAMLVARTPSLQLLRRCFVGRAIHSSEQRWIGDIEKALLG